MFVSAYLTIDDSPTRKTADLVRFLVEHDIQALFFARGDFLELDPQPVIDAIKQGMVIGNHNYSHTRASQMSYAQCVGEIERTQALIDVAYEEAGVLQEHKYFRFPHMDRGAGGWVIDYDAAPEYKDHLMPLFADGLNVSLDKPSQVQIENKHRLQDYLKNNGYSKPFQDVSFDWYQNSEMASAIDAMYSFSTSDWMLSQRHLARDWPYKTLEDLQGKIDKELLSDSTSPHIVLAHDQEEICLKTLALIGYMLDKGVEFLPIK